jgi:hypothetical protein
MNKENALALSAASFMARYKSRSYDQKLSVSKVPLKVDELSKSRTLSPIKRRRIEDQRDRDTNKHKLERMCKIILRKLCLKFGRYVIYLGFKCN